MKPLRLSLSVEIVGTDVASAGHWGRMVLQQNQAPMECVVAGSWFLRGPIPAMPSASGSYHHNTRVLSPLLITLRPSHFILNHCVNNGLFPDVIYSGSKIMTMTIKKGVDIRCIDSLNFLPMALKKLPATLGLNAELEERGVSTFS